MTPAASVSTSGHTPPYAAVEAGVTRVSAGCMADRMSSQKRRTAAAREGSVPDRRGQAPPAEGRTYDVRFSGRLTADDRTALMRPRFMLTDNAFGVFAPDVGEGTAR